MLYQNEGYIYRSLRSAKISERRRRCGCFRAKRSKSAGSYKQEARMIHPIYAPLKYCNLRYSMRRIFKLISFCSSSKTKVWSCGISRGGFRFVFPFEIKFIFATQKGASRTPGTLPRLRTWMYRSGQQGKITERLPSVKRARISIWAYNLFSDSLKCRHAFITMPLLPW